MNIHRFLIISVAALAIVGCDRKPTTSEKVEDKVKDALDARPHEKVKDATEDTKDAVKDASKDVKDAVKDATK